MTIEIYRVKTAQPGRLFVMPSPPAAPLPEFMQLVRGHGADEVVSLLTANDASSLGLQDEPRTCNDVGMAFTSFPIPDFGLPDPAAFSALVARLAGDIAGGRGIAVHCRAGIGRSGLLACCVLKHFGHSGEAAIALVSQARRHAVPDNLIQRNFIISYVQNGGSADDSP